MGLTQGGAPCGRLPWAILGRAFGAENQRQQKTTNYQWVTDYSELADCAAEMLAFIDRHGELLRKIDADLDAHGLRKKARRHRQRQAAGEASPAALDRHVRQGDENPSIGIILCKEKSRTIGEYALHNANNPIGVATYEITRTLPKALKGQLPSPKDITHLLEDL